MANILKIVEKVLMTNNKYVSEDKKHFFEEIDGTLIFDK